MAKYGHFTYIQAKMALRLYWGRVVQGNPAVVGELMMLENALVGVQAASGKVVLFEKEVADVEQTLGKHGLGPLAGHELLKVQGKSFLCPGFIDTHTHAPQYVYTGTGVDLPLLQWLEKYTFPREAEYSQTDHARVAYQQVVKKHIDAGTTTACYYGTIHRKACEVLTDVCIEKGQRAWIGKVNMDRNAPDYYIEQDTETSIRDTKAFISYVQQKQNELVTPVLTPRFVPTCTPELMKELGELAEKHDLPIQSHLSENEEEIEWVRSLHPDHDSYTEVYEHFGLLRAPSIMAHCIHLTEPELRVMQKNQVSIAHCPSSNFSLSSGIMPLRTYLERGLTVGLGTDVAGGPAPSMLDAMRHAITASKAAHIADRSLKPLSSGEAFWLATVGGAKCLGLGDKIGTFDVGNQFDALLVTLEGDHQRVDIWSFDGLKEMLEKFVFVGDDRNISKVWVAGRLIKE